LDRIQWGDLQLPEDSFSFLAESAKEKISDDEFQHNGAQINDFSLRSKEELLYFQIFEGIFGSSMSSRIKGLTRSITSSELQ